MNTKRTRLLALVTASLLFASLGRADEKSYLKILEERDAVLSRLVVMHEAQFAALGGSKDGDESVVSARLALWSFRRDTARLKTEKVKQQELIVAVYQKRLVEQKNRVKAGIAGDADVLLATDSLLQAQQLLEELRLDEKKG